MENETKDIVAKQSQSLAELTPESARTVQEVMGRIMVARQFPRDTVRAFNNAMKDCERLSFAEVSQYSYPRSGTTITGASMRLIESLVRHFGNVDMGWRVVSQNERQSEIECVAWDMENNVRATKNITVKHVRSTRKGIFELTDPRDIYENNANQASRRLRSCLEQIIPRDFIEAAIAKCNETMVGGVKESLEDRIRGMVKAFSDLGVTQDMLEQRLQHKIDITTVVEVVGLQKIYISIKNEAATREDFFEFTDKDMPESEANNKFYKKEVKKEYALEKEKEAKKDAGKSKANSEPEHGDLV